MGLQMNFSGFLRWLWIIQALIVLAVFVSIYSNESSKGPFSDGFLLVLGFVIVSLFMVVGWKVKVEGVVSRVAVFVIVFPCVNAMKAQAKV